MRFLAFLFAVTFLSASAMAMGDCGYSTAKDDSVVASSSPGSSSDGSAPQSTPAPKS